MWSPWAQERKSAGLALFTGMVKWKSCKLEVWTKEKFGSVITRIASDLLDCDFGIGQRVLRLYLLGRVRICRYVMHDPVIQPALHVAALLERSNLIANDTFEIMRKSAGCEKIRQAGGEVGIGRRIGIVVHLRLL